MFGFWGSIRIDNCSIKPFTALHFMVFWGGFFVNVFTFFTVAVEDLLEQPLDLGIAWFTPGRMQPIALTLFDGMVALFCQDVVENGCKLPKPR